MTPTSRSTILSYAAAIVATGVAAGFSLISPQDVSYHFLLFLAAVTFSAWYGGLRAGLLALFIGTVLLAVSFAVPGLGLEPKLIHVIGLALFALVAVFVMTVLLTQERTARQLHEEHERMRVTLGSIGDAVIATDSAGMITFMNDMAIRLTGWPREEALGKPVDSVFRIKREIPNPTGAAEPPLENPALRALHTGNPVLVDDDVMLLARDGSMLTVDDSVAPIRAADGSLLGAILVFRDGTDRRRNEQALIEANQSFQALINAAPLAVIVFDRQGIVRLWSPAAERIFGWTAEEAIGRVLPPVSPDKMEEFRATREFVASGKMLISYEAERQRKDGSRVDVSFSTAPLRDPEGNVTEFITIVDDISEMKRAENALRESETHLRNVLDSLFTFVCVLTPEGTLIEANRATLEAAGLKAEDVLGKPYDQTYWWNYSEDVQERVRNAIERGAQGIPSRFDEEIRVADDRRMIIDFMLAPMLGESGEVRYLVPSAIDVTERNRTNERLIESEARYRAIGESIAYGVWMSDGYGVLTYLSQSFLDLVGKAPDEMIGRNWMEFSHLLEMSPEAINALKEGYGKRQSLNVELQIRDLQGDLHAILCRGVPLRGAADQVTGWVGVNLDVTESKKEERLNSLLQAITAELSKAVTPVMVGEAVAQTLHHGLNAKLTNIAMVSEDGEQLEILANLGLEPALREQFQRIPLEHPGALNDAIRRDEAIWIETQDEYVHRYPAVGDLVRHETHTHSAACIPLHVRDKVVGGIGIAYGEAHHFDEAEHGFLNSVADLTGQALERARLYEAEAEARLEAERADWMKMRFLAIVSHELRTPLTSIKGFATTLLETDVTWDAESQRDFITIINDEADKLAEMIDQLLDFSRLEAGTLRIQRERTTINQILSLTLPQIQVLCQNHVLSMEVPLDLPDIDADRTRIGQVMTNLVGNAARYSPAGSNITIAARTDGSVVRVDIKDEGPGIPKEEREAVFEAFRQGESHHHAEVKGAGLGLAIARGIIAAHQGRIWIEDHASSGTTVAFVLPVDSGDGGDYT